MNRIAFGCRISFATQEQLRSIKQKEKWAPPSENLSWRSLPLFFYNAQEQFLGGEAYPAAEGDPVHPVIFYLQQKGL